MVILLFIGMALTDHEMVDIHYNKMASLQVIFFLISTVNWSVYVHCVTTYIVLWLFRERLSYRNVNRYVVYLYLHFQRAVFKYFPELHDFAMSNIASIDTREALLQHFGSLS